jgi:putative chitobiose transport system permease protein
MARLLKRKINRSAWGDFTLFLFLFLGGVFMVLPFVFVIVNAFKPMDELFLFPPRFFVMRPTTDNFKMLGKLTSSLWVPFSRYAFNSILVTVVGTVGCVLISSLAAYPLAKHKFAGKTLLLQLVTLALLFTNEVVEVPRYIVLAKLGMVNTYFAIIFPALAGSMGVFLMEKFMRQFPDSTLEAARIDGASEFTIFWRIMMPFQRPAWLTLVIFTFTSIWNSTGGILIYDEQMKVLPTILKQISSGGIARSGVGSAVALLLLIPPIIIFVVSQSSVMETMAQSGMK